MPIPAGYMVTHRTPVFAHDTIPPAVLSAHETKGGAWATIHVLERKLRYCVETPPSESIPKPGLSGVLEPEIRLYVGPLGPGRFYLEFYHAPQCHPGLDTQHQPKRPGEWPRRGRGRG